MSSNDTTIVLVDNNTASSSSSCGELCGWAAAFVSMLAFGTFGVPIKSEVCQRLDIDPLVFQTYKTVMCFLTSWLILLHHDTPFQFTPWGIISGLFWVPGGWCTVFAVKVAGLAVGVGVGSSFIVLVSFVWGIFIFQESVQSVIGACMAVGLMICGIIGMAYYSSPSSSSSSSSAALVVAEENTSSLSTALPSQQQQQQQQQQQPPTSTGRNTTSPCPTFSMGVIGATNATSSTTTTTRPSPSGYEVLSKKDDDYFVVGTTTTATRTQQQQQQQSRATSTTATTTKGAPGTSIAIAPYRDDPTTTAAEDRSRSTSNTLDDYYFNSSTAGSSSSNDGEEEEFHDEENEEEDPELMLANIDVQLHHQQQRQQRPEFVSICGGRFRFRLRTLGILAAVFNGTYGGSVMVPMHYAPSSVMGMAYVISFGIGALLVNILLWVVRYGIAVVRWKGDTRRAWNNLPSFHLAAMWRAGGLSGLLWSIGNFASLLSVEFLGQGVGYSVVQSAMLVSGLWGIFYFHEIQGWRTISKWLLSATLTVTGILWLSYEHHAGGEGG